MHATMTVTRTHCHVVITSQGGPGPLRGAGGSEGQGEVERGPWHMVATLLLSRCRTSQGVGEGGRMRARVMTMTLFIAGQARAWCAGLGWARVGSGGQARSPLVVAGVLAQWLEAHHR